MGELLTKLVELFVHGNKGSIIKLLLLILLTIIILPIGLNYFYVNVKIEQEIRILNDLISIDTENINDNRLMEYYERILNSLNKNEQSILGISIINNKHESLREYFTVENIIKFISGSFWFILLFIISIFIKQNTVGMKIAVQIIFFIAILLLGIIGIIIPTFSQFAINIIGFPLIQLIAVIAITVMVNKAKKNTQN